MDGLAVSVVPEERAGMATGIFSTTRVAGEGDNTIAIVGALVTLFIQMRCRKGSAAATIETARRLAMGNVAAASQVSTTVPGSDPRLWGRFPVADLCADARHGWLCVVVGWLLDETTPAPQYEALNRQRAN